eukprot:scpid50927/ scgid13235/ 
MLLNRFVQLRRRPLWVVVQVLAPAIVLSLILTYIRFGSYTAEWLDQGSHHSHRHRNTRHNANGPCPGAIRSASVKAAGTLPVGQRWYRYGQPFYQMSVSDIAFAFQATAPVPNASTPLLYAQRLSGLFRDHQEQYITVLVDSTRISARLKRSTAPDGQLARVETIHKRLDIRPRHWYVVCVSSSPKLDLFVVHVSSVLLLSAPGNAAWCQCYSRLAENSVHSTPGNSAAKTAAGILLDSGVYFGGVIDRANTPGLIGLPKSAAIFKGNVFGTVFLNSQSIDIAVGPDNTAQGSSMEQWRKEYGMINLTQPITFTPRRRTADVNDPAFSFPIISAVSDNHAEEAHDMIGSVRAMMPRRGVIMYDLGLTRNSKAVLRSFCNVSVRAYRKDLFADLVAHNVIKECRWKPVLLLAGFLEFGGVIWSDASVRFIKPIEQLGLVLDGFGFVGFYERGLTGAYTHDGTLKELGVTRASVAEDRMSIGTCSAHLNGNSVSPVLMRQFVGCSFHKKCLSPPGARLSVVFCQKKEALSGKYIGCHRYDQSVLSVVLSKMFPGPSLAGAQIFARDFFDVVRHSTKQFPRCYNNATRAP